MHEFVCVCVCARVKQYKWMVVGGDGIGVWHRMGCDTEKGEGVTQVEGCGCWWIC